MNQTALTDFGTRYAAAWSSQNPVSLASFYNEKGSLIAESKGLLPAASTLSP
jgi:hypothetical protein